jgi:phosphomannomutase
MRAEDAVYGGEMSAHHYFRDFYYCDSGMIPWLLIAQLLCEQPSPLSELVATAVNSYPVTGEINRKVANAQQLFLEIENRYAKHAERIDHTDGLSMEFADWRFNLRASNTEPVIRLNVETRANPGLMQVKRDELLALVDNAS